jgi:hypothetical protein
MNPLVAEPGRRPPPRRAHCAFGQRQQGGLAAQHAPPGHPSVVRAATLCLQAGADGITVHPRPDERHIRAHDVHDLAALLREWPQAEYNIEGNPFHNLMDFIRVVRPHQATFVPDSEGQFTSDHGWDLAADAARLRPLIDECRDWACASASSWTRCPKPWPLRAPSAPTASSCTPNPMRRRMAKPGRQASWHALHRRRAAAQVARPGRQRRPRPEPRQPGRLPAGRAGCFGGVHRPCARGRCAGTRPARDRARLPALHPRRGCAAVITASAPTVRHPPHRRDAGAAR